MSNKSNFVSIEEVTVLLSSLSTDQLSRVIGKAATIKGARPLDVTMLLLDLIATVAVTTMTPNDRAIVVSRTRDVSDLVERELLPRTGTH